MRNRKIKYLIIAGFLALAIILAVVISHGKNVAMSVVFLDVGQGDSILISQGSQQLLIDGGKDGKLLLEKLGKHVPFWDRKIETVVETHPDADHIGGLIDVLNTYAVDSVLETKMQSDSQTFKKLEDTIFQRGIQKIEAKKDVKIKFTNGAVAEVLYPLETVADVNDKDTNASSVVVKLTIGDSKFLFTGDLPTTEENKLLENKIDVSADFLKVSHHGSKYATSNDFLKAVHPVDAIISVGKNNSYGHPNSEVLQRLSQNRINVLRTDEIGDVVYECQNIKGKCKIISN
ncbi:MAG: ComEC/Rec2 family competence protein [Candidatus Moranbacteria bacterium]|nr:ComEC/Rec2 family competence protein [Candidatus Moranbacteria bacterium]